MDTNLEIAKQILRVRLSQMIVNEKYKKGEFKVPIHQAFGHEAIAVAVDFVMKGNDKLVLSHRNIHYNLARLRSLKPELNEYLLREDSLAEAELGSMNLANPEKNIVYASSILGNNVAVTSGIALGQKVKKLNGVVFLVLGDGAIEEGNFYEGLLFLKSYRLSCLIIVENNQWSMSTKINERRCDIDLTSLTKAFNIRYERISGNDVFEYIKKLRELRDYALAEKTPVCLEVDITTFGSWILKTEEYPDGKFVNYHAGPSPSISLSEWPMLEESDADPIFVLKKYYDEEELKNISKEMLEWLKEDTNEIH